MVLINTRFLGEPYIDIKHRAVTEYAVIEYRFSDWSGVQNRARLYAAKGLGKYVSQNLAYEFKRQKYLLDYIRTIGMFVYQVKDLLSRIGECRHVSPDVFVLVMDRNSTCLKSSHLFALP